MSANDLWKYLACRSFQREFVWGERGGYSIAPVSIDIACEKKRKKQWVMKDAYFYPAAICSVHAEWRMNLGLIFQNKDFYWILFLHRIFHSRFGIVESTPSSRKLCFFYQLHASLCDRILRVLFSFFFFFCIRYNTRLNKMWSCDFVPIKILFSITVLPFKIACSSSLV